MIVRRAEQRDRLTIAAVHAQSWRDSYRGILPDRLLDGELGALMASRWNEQEIRPEDAVLIAEGGGEMLGFCATWDGDSPYIDNLHVREGARSQGVGRRLLAETARHFLAGGRRTAHLHVVAANRRARSLYILLGGRPAGLEAKDLYGTIVTNERIEWSDLAVLLERAEAPATPL